jgi:hypothetical protein
MSQQSSFVLAVSLAIAVLSGGCSLNRAPIAPRFDAGLRDAPTMDTPALDAPTFDTPALDTPALDTPALDVPEQTDVPEPIDAPTSDVPTVVDAPTPDVPAMVDAAVLDAPVILDAPRPDVPAIPDAPSFDTPVRDAPILRDTPPDDAPSACSRYAAFTGHEACPVTTPGICRFYLNPADPRTCEDLCGFVPGSTCLAAYGVSGMRCGGVSAGTATSCSTALDPLVCDCTDVGSL